MKYFSLIFSLISFTLAHMEFITPYHRYSKYSPYYKSIGKVDWNGLDPLGNNGSFTYPYPCKGQPKGPVQATYKAGDTIPVEFTGTAIHNGGHCQFAISYDDKKFVVIKDVFTTCIVEGLKYNIQLPATLPPSKNATFVWGWINAVGNREWYMNCVDIEITGGVPNGKFSGPEMLVANLPGKIVFGEFALEGPHTERFASRPIITVP